MGEVWEAEPPMAPHASAFALQGFFRARKGDRAGAEIAFFRALSVNPWETDVACEALEPPALPPDDDRGALCVAARTWSRY